MLLAQVSLLDRCGGDPGDCRVRHLAFVEVRRFFGDGQMPACCLGSTQTVRKNVNMMITRYIDARTGTTIRETVR
jgi:hypothetical protein